MARKDDLEACIRASYELVRQYEGIVQLSSDPKEKRRCQSEIAEQWTLIRGWLREYERVVQGPPPNDISQIAACSAREGVTVAAAKRARQEEQERAPREPAPPHSRAPAACSLSPSHEVGMGGGRGRGGAGFPTPVFLPLVWALVGLVAVVAVVALLATQFDGEPTPVPPTSTQQPTAAPTSTSRLTVAPTSIPWSTAMLTSTPRPTATPTTSSLPPACTASGQTWTRPVDGMVMVCVPAGEFLMGSEDSDTQADSDEKPQHEVYLDAYWIDRTEVTNAQYRRCVDDGECAESVYRDHTTYNAANQPVVGVSWYNTVDYCAWVGGALPTEAQWEKAARGPDGRLYPWGHLFDGRKLNYCDANCPYDSKDTAVDDGYRFTAPVGSYPDGVSPYGALDMAGNVWEWVADRYEAGYYTLSPAANPTGPATGEYRVLRGGAWADNTGWVRSAYRLKRVPTGVDVYLGFRCVVPVR